LQNFVKLLGAYGVLAAENLYIFAIYTPKQQLLETNKERKTKKHPNKQVPSFPVWFDELQLEEQHSFIAQTKQVANINLDSTSPQLEQ
jgi:hypothetical protein